jgi:hypothetical protein
MLPVTLENQTPRRSALLIAAFANAVLALLVIASAASAGATGGLDPTSAATATGAAPAEPVPETAANSGAPVEPAEAPTPSGESQRIETPEAPSATASTRATASAVDEPVASAPGNPPISTQAADPAGRSATIADSVSTGATSVVPAEEEARSTATIAHVAQHQVVALDEGIRQNSETTVGGNRQDLPGTVANLRQGVAEEISALSDRLPPAAAGNSLSSLLDTSSPASAAIMPPSAGPAQTDGDSSKGGALDFFEPLPAGLFSNWNPIASGGSTGKRLILSGSGRADKVESASRRPGTLGKVSPPATSGAGTSLDASSSKGPAPLDVPLPTPKSPEAIAPGSGDAFFVPFVALLALLALVAPASMRRLREVPDFRAPTPFVCALERPG